MNTETRTLDGAIEAVCNFWIEKMQKPLNQNIGDNSELGVMAFALMNLVGSHAQKSITPEKIDTFRRSLAEIIRCEFSNGRYICYVDYNPCSRLAAACDAAGIDYGALPCKSHTNIHKYFSVQSRFGYGSEFVQLY